MSRGSRCASFERPRGGIGQRCEGGIDRHVERKAEGEGRDQLPAARKRRARRQLVCAIGRQAMQPGRSVRQHGSRCSLRPCSPTPAAGPLAANLGSDGGDRRPARWMIALVVQHHADRPFTNVRCKLVRRLAHRRPFLSGVRASGNSVAVQYRPASDPRDPYKLLHWRSSGPHRQTIQLFVAVAALGRYRSFRFWEVRDV